MLCVPTWTLTQKVKGGPHDLEMSTARCADDVPSQPRVPVRRRHSRSIIGPVASACQAEQGDDKANAIAQPERKWAGQDKHDFTFMVRG